MLNKMLRTVRGGSIHLVLILIATSLPAWANDQVLDLSTYSIEKISPFTSAGFNNKYMLQSRPLPQPKVNLDPGDLLIVKLSNKEGRSDYGPCHLDSKVDDLKNKAIMGLAPNRYIAISSGEGKIVVYANGPGLGVIEPSMEIMVTVAPLSMQKEEALLKRVEPSDSSKKTIDCPDAIEAIKSEISGVVYNTYNAVIENRSRLLHSYMYVLARRDGKNCIPFLAGLLNADADAKKEVFSCIKTLTEDDYSKSPERSTQSWEEWWQAHATKYDASSPIKNR